MSAAKQATGYFTKTHAFRSFHRLRGAADFSRAFREGVRCADRYFKVVACPNTLGYPRLGMAVARAAVGNAVRRNRVQRVIRDEFRIRRSSLPTLDFVVIARRGVGDADNESLRVSLRALWDKVAKRCDCS